MNSDRIYYSHDAEMQALRGRAVLMLVFLTFGLGIGAALAVLFSPVSGKKARRELAESLGDGLNTGRESIEPFMKRLEEQFNDLRKSVDERMKHA
ncbi:MAG: YtxH domain-containing protein [Chloroflexi bacterium]|nr:YtxH domain-containing protein [Chloroflexota bacterium]